MCICKHVRKKGTFVITRTKTETETKCTSLKTCCEQHWLLGEYRSLQNAGSTTCACTSANRLKVCSCCDFSWKATRENPQLRWCFLGTASNTASVMSLTCPREHRKKHDTEFLSKCCQSVEYSAVGEGSYSTDIMREFFLLLSSPHIPPTKKQVMTFAS